MNHELMRDTQEQRRKSADPALSMIHAWRQLGRSTSALSFCISLGKRRNNLQYNTIEIVNRLAHYY